MSWCWLLVGFGVLPACTEVGFSEQQVAIPQYAWKSTFQPAFPVTISDTLARYRIYVVLRHTDAYRYKNLWLNITTQVPGAPPVSARHNLILATDEKGWLGKGMDDIFEHRILLTEQPGSFPRKGTYTYTLQQLMREDPLEHIMNAGIRVEKVNE